MHFTAVANMGMVEFTCSLHDLFLRKAYHAVSTAASFFSVQLSTRDLVAPDVLL